MTNGYGVSPGIAIGKVVIKKTFEYTVNEEQVSNIEEEVDRFKKAVATCKEETNRLYDKMLEVSGEEEAQIFKAHLLILEDPELIETIISKIEATSKSASYCLEEVANHFIEMFEQMDNEYLKERALDIRDIKERLMKVLFGFKDLNDITLENQIIVAHELTPSDTAKLDLTRVKGFITETGGKTSHTAIMAKSLEIPAIVGVGKILEDISTETPLVMNGSTGEFIIDPDRGTREKFMHQLKQYNNYRNKLKKYIGERTISTDGKVVELAANIGTYSDIKGVLDNDGEGIGLFRTEFLYMDSHDFPTEEEQFKVYKGVVSKMNGKPVVIRTLDIGGDKELPYYAFPEEMNPFLGYRAIRMCLDQKELFKVQLRAILRASVYGKIRIMFPMIATVRELLEAKVILSEVMDSLDEASILYDKNIEVGMMIEVPSAAIMSDILAKHVDFFSIGTNDLIQYTVAVDRMNENLKELYDPFNPAVLRLINRIIKNGHKEDIWVGMCGEVAGDLKIIPLLLGMGLDEFSMSAINILPARFLMNNLNGAVLEEYVALALQAETSVEVKEIVNRMIKQLSLERFYRNY